MIQGDDTPGNTLVIASWGSVSIPIAPSDGDALSVAVLGALRVLLGLDTELPAGSDKDTVPLAEWELRRLALRSFVDNAMHTMSSVEAMRRLADGISNVVVSDEVSPSYCSRLICRSATRLRRRLRGRRGR